MKKPDLIPLVAWIVWEMFFEEPEPTNAHPEDNQREEPPEVRTPSRSR